MCKNISWGRDKVCWLYCEMALNAKPGVEIFLCCNVWLDGGKSCSENLMTKHGFELTTKNAWNVLFWLILDQCDNVHLSVKTIVLVVRSCKLVSVSKTELL